MVTLMDYTIQAHFRSPLNDLPHGIIANQWMPKKLAERIHYCTTVMPLYENGQQKSPILEK